MVSGASSPLVVTSRRSPSRRRNPRARTAVVGAAAAALLLLHLCGAAPHVAALCAGEATPQLGGVATRRPGQPASRRDDPSAQPPRDEQAPGSQVGCIPISLFQAVRLIIQAINTTTDEPISDQGLNYQSTKFRSRPQTANPWLFFLTDI